MAPKNDRSSQNVIPNIEQAKASGHCFADESTKHSVLMKNVKK
jgi:hypothetical protein